MQFQTIITSRHQPQPSYYANPIPKINRAIYSLFALYFRAFDNLIQSQKLTKQFTRYSLTNTAHTITTSAFKAYSTSSAIHSLHSHTSNNLIQPQKLTKQFTRYLLANTEYRGKNTRRPGNKTTRYPRLRNIPTTPDCYHITTREIITSCSIIFQSTPQ
jgi:hypothetical protein